MTRKILVPWNKNLKSFEPSKESVSESAPTTKLLEQGNVTVRNIPLEKATNRSAAFLPFVDWIHFYTSIWAMIAASCGMVEGVVREG